MKNKFILFILGALIFLSVSSFCYYYFVYKIDRNSYFVLLQGNARLNQQMLKVEEKKRLYVGDSIRTIGENSFGVIEWGDGSITRMGGNSIVEVQDLFVSDDLTQIQLAFELKKGKSWSHVINFFGEGSYFRETFQDTTASVRGTVFDIDLSQNYLHVLDHEVELVTQTGKNFIIGENQPFSLQTFSFIDLQTFINTIKNQAWEDLNQKYDIEYLQELKNEIQLALEKGNPFKNLENLVNQSYMPGISEEQKQLLYNKLLGEYQKISFVNTDDEGLYEQKLKLKSALFMSASSENKKTLLQSIRYDVEDLIENDKIEKIKEIFGTSIDFSAWNIEFPELVEKVKTWKQNTDKKIHDALDSLFQLK